MIAPIAAELPQSVSEPPLHPSRFLSVDFKEPDMAFIDDATHTGMPLCDSPIMRMPRQILTLAALATSVAIWAIIILLVAGRL